MAESFEYSVEVTAVMDPSSFERIDTECDSFSIGSSLWSGHTPTIDLEGENTTLTEIW
jgi:hypothetical protein